MHATNSFLLLFLKRSSIFQCPPELFQITLTLREVQYNAIMAQEKLPGATESALQAGPSPPSPHEINEYTVAHAQAQAIDPDSGVKRGLKNRHLSMMALAGIVGPGLLIGSGGALASGGPASLLIGFGVIGIIAFSIMQSLGEVTTLYPAAGSFVGLAERVVDRGFSAAVGWVRLNEYF